MNKFSINKFGDFRQKKCWQHMQKNGNRSCPSCKIKAHLKKEKIIKDVYVWECQNSIDKKWYQCRDMFLNWTDAKPARLHVATDITENKHAELYLEKMVKEKTLHLINEILHREKTEKKLELKGRHLQQANLALKSMLDHRDAERRAIEENTYMNIQTYILPYLDEIAACTTDDRIKIPVNVIRSSINQILAPVSETLFAEYANLTPMEVKVANLVKQGMRTKEIGNHLNIAPGSVSTYRNSIRKKLNLRNSKTNLRVYLNSFK